MFRNMVVFVTYISLSNASLQLYSINDGYDLIQINHLILIDLFSIEKKGLVGTKHLHL